MLSLVKTKSGVGFIELQDRPEPRPKAGEVLIEVKACGVCGTDIHILHDKFRCWPPVILGHEFSGVVVANGTGAGRFKAGDRVVAEPHCGACGHCYLCRSGNIHICAMKRAPGWGVDGAFAKYVVMPEPLLHRIPDHLDYDAAAVVEPTANAVHDVIERARFQAGDFAVVLGPGPIGLLSAMAARAAGARHVVVIGTPQDEAVRLAKARELGFDTVNLAEADPVKHVMNLTDGLGADMVIEASGSAQGAAATPDYIRRLGKICVIGLTGLESIEFPWDRAAYKACEIIYGLSTGYSSWDRSIALVASGAIPAGRIVTHRLPLSEWKHGFEQLEARRAIKVLLVPEG